jgi:hypothetical protein
MNTPAARVVSLVSAAERSQAECYKAVLDEQRGRLAEEIAAHAALKSCQDNGQVREMRHLS